MRIRMCNCEHPHRAHEHYRAGTECGLCTCQAFDEAGARRGWRARLIHALTGR